MRKVDYKASIKGFFSQTGDRLTGDSKIALPQN
jgi:hypothetical protein